jgi:nucleoside-diphosphate-sugar epimerase
MSAGRVVVLGGSSFLARHLVQQLTAYETSVYDRSGAKQFNYPVAIPDINELAEHDAIVLTAASGVQPGRDQNVFGVNTFFPIQLVDGLDARKFKGQLITFGSYFEIGDCSSDKIFTEVEVVHSDNPAANSYVISKRLLTRFWSSYQGGLKWFHLILPSLYGKGENPARIISYLIGALREGAKLRVSEGSQVRQYLHVNDVVSFIRMILNAEVQPGIYNLAPANAISIAELRSKVVRAVGSGHVELEIIPSRDEGQKVLKLSNAKAMATGWQPAVSIEEGINSYLK